MQDEAIRQHFEPLEQAAFHVESPSQFLELIFVLLRRIALDAPGEATSGPLTESAFWAIFNGSVAVLNALNAKLNDITQRPGAGGARRLTVQMKALLPDTLARIRFPAGFLSAIGNLSDSELLSLAGRVNAVVGAWIAIYMDEHYSLRPEEATALAQSGFFHLIATDPRMLALMPDGLVDALVAYEPETPELTSANPLIQLEADGKTPVVLEIAAAVARFNKDVLHHLACASRASAKSLSAPIQIVLDMLLFFESQAKPPLPETDTFVFDGTWNYASVLNETRDAIFLRRERHDCVFDLPRVSRLRYFIRYPVALQHFSAAISLERRLAYDRDAYGYTFEYARERHRSLSVQLGRQLERKLRQLDSMVRVSSAARETMRATSDALRTVFGRMYAELPRVAVFGTAVYVAGLAIDLPEAGAAAAVEVVGHMLVAALYGEASSVDSESDESS